MQLSGSTSWRFAESVHEQLLLALWVRDALRLQVGQGPPRLAGPVADLREHRRGPAADQWTVWWRALVEDAVLLHDGRPRPPGRALDRSPAGDPVALVDGPDLRAAVSSLLHKGLRAVEPARRALQFPAGRGAFAWKTVREVAEDVAFDYRVDLDRVRGVALVLPVDGLWWEPAGPGAVLCSPAAAAHGVTGRVALRAAFATGLRRT